MLNRTCLRLTWDIGFSLIRSSLCWRPVCSLPTSRRSSLLPKPYCQATSTGYRCSLASLAACPLAVGSFGHAAHPHPSVATYDWGSPAPVVMLNLVLSRLVFLSHPRACPLLRHCAVWCSVVQHSDCAPTLIRHTWHQVSVPALLYFGGQPLPIHQRVIRVVYQQPLSGNSFGHVCHTYRK
jgi:hypothetical protein